LKERIVEGDGKQRRNLVAALFGNGLELESVDAILGQGVGVDKGERESQQEEKGEGKESA